MKRAAKHMSNTHSKNLNTISSSNSNKPAIADETYAKWQKKVDLIAELIEAPAALIMKVDPQQVEVFVASLTKGNPYRKGEKADLNTGLYCETVIEELSLLHVPNALKDQKWDNNPDIKFGMVSYIGLPLRWPNGDVFGTICILDSKENYNMLKYRDLLFEFKDGCERELQYLLKINEIKQVNKELQEALAEVKALSGLLPICSSCKKIRDDKGYWKQLEGYIQEHSDAEFTHGICPECVEKLYPDLVDN